MFDEERAQDRQGRQVLDSQGDPVTQGEDAGDEAPGRLPTGRFSPEEAERREPRKVRPRSIALAPPPPGP